jgi:class 3 adenylate cyclase
VKGRLGCMPLKVIKNAITREAFYIFADIRGFTSWSTKNQLEIPKLLDFTYKCSLDLFGERKEQAYLQRVVKFLGDGFFAVNEYKPDDQDDFINKLNDTLYKCFTFINTFHKKLDSLNLHEKDSLGVSIGVSFGPSLRFNISGQSFDYSGKSVNLASRLCGIGKDRALILEIALDDYKDKMQFSVSKHYEIDSREIKNLGETKVVYILILEY